jgi:hypothetical protein
VHSFDWLDHTRRVRSITSVDVEPVGSIAWVRTRFVAAVESGDL